MTTQNRFNVLSFSGIVWQFGVEWKKPGILNAFELKPFDPWTWCFIFQCLGGLTHWEILHKFQELYFQELAFFNEEKICGIG